MHPGAFNPLSVGPGPYSSAWFRLNALRSADPAVAGVSGFVAHRERGVHPVGTAAVDTDSDPATGNRLAICDMSGNSYEWCYDWYYRFSQYDMGDVKNPQGYSASGGRIKRGAGWNYEAFKCTVDYRYNSQPYEAADSLGFRVAQSLPEN